MFGRSKIVEQLKTHGASLQQRNRFGISSKWMVGILAVNGLAGTRGDGLQPENANQAGSTVPHENFRVTGQFCKSSPKNLDHLKTVTRAPNCR
jgi:hypothetical protein